MLAGGWVIFNFEVIGDSHASARNNTERSYAPWLSFPLILITRKTVVEDHNQGVT